MKTNEISTGGFYRLADSPEKFKADAGTTVMVVAAWRTRSGRGISHFTVENEGERTYEVKAADLRPVLHAEDYQPVIDEMQRDGFAWLMRERATKEYVRNLRAYAKTQGVRFRSETGYTMHGMKVITVTLVEEG